MSGGMRLGFLDNLDGVPLGVANLKVARSLTVPLDGSAFDPPSGKHSLHPVDSLGEQDQSLICPVACLRGQRDRFPALFELVSGAVMLSPRVLSCLAESKFVGVPR